MYHSALEGTWDLEFPTCEDANHLQATTCHQPYEQFGRELCTLQILNCIQIMYQVQLIYN
jgi:hypothetical protein